MSKLRRALTVLLRFFSKTYATNSSRRKDKSISHPESIASHSTSSSRTPRCGGPTDSARNHSTLSAHADSLTDKSQTNDTHAPAYELSNFDSSATKRDRVLCS